MKISMFEIVDRAELMNKITFIKPKGIYPNELMADLILSYYVFGDLNILDISSKEIYYECLNIFCDQVAVGAIHSKWHIARQLIDINNEYLIPDKKLAAFLIDLAAYENEPYACDFLENKYLEIGRHDLANFWNIKSQIGCLDKIGVPLNLVVDKKGKYIELSLFD